MKRIIFIVIVIFVSLFVLSGCNNDDGINTFEQPYHINYILSARNSDGDILYYGMSRADAEAILGQGEAFALNDNIYTYKNRTVSIVYRDDIAVSIRLHIGSGDWVLTNGLHVGMQVSDQVEFYGMSVEDRRNLFNYSLNLPEDFAATLVAVAYRFNIDDDDSLELITTVEEYREEIVGHDPVYHRFVVSFSMSDDDIVDGIAFGDQLAITGR